MVYDREKQMLREANIEMDQVLIDACTRALPKSFTRQVEERKIAQTQTKADADQQIKARRGKMEEAETEDKATPGSAEPHAQAKAAEQAELFSITKMSKTSLCTTMTPSRWPVLTK